MGLRKRLSLSQLIRRDKITDMREIYELLEHEQRQWGPRMRYINGLGTPMAGLGFAGVVIPNNEVVTSPASVSSQTEVSLMQPALASTGSNTYMYIPAGSFRAPQSWRVWAGGTFSTGATTTTLTWTTRIGNSTTASSNASIGATGAMAPGSTGAGGVAAASVTAAPWWYEAHMAIRQPGASTTGVGIGFFQVSLAAQQTSVATMTGIGGGASFNIDTTQGAYWNIGITSSASATTGAQLQALTIVAWD